MTIKFWHKLFCSSNLDEVEAYLYCIEHGYTTTLQSMSNSNQMHKIWYDIYSQNKMEAEMASDFDREQNESTWKVLHVP